MREPLERRADQVIDIGRFSCEALKRIAPAGQAADFPIWVYLAPANQYDKGLMEDPVDRLLQRFAADKSSTVVVSFLLTSGVKEISEKDRFWSDWLDVKKADHVVVIADLPKNFGGADPERRRVLIPLDKKKWKGLPQDTVRVEVRESEVKLLTPPAS